MDLRVHTLDGREVEILISAAPMRDREGQIIGAIVSGIEMTERNQLARDREEARANELAAHEVIQRLDTFIGMAAHDLRTPLTVSSMRLQIAHAKVARSIARTSRDNSELAEALAQAAESLEAAEGSHHRLQRMVELLLDVSRARTGVLRLEKHLCHLDVLVRTCVEEQRLLAHGRAITLHEAVSEPVPVQADADRISQVVTNYLVNAIRYSPAGEPVEVALRLTGKMARVEVRDQGPGIPFEEQDAVWERFVQAKSIEEPVLSPGLGLGLYIVRMLVELHGGQVGVVSAPGTGAMFWFTMPLASEAVASDGTDPQTA
jgi:signal transduction histidine kinase